MADKRIAMLKKLREARKLDPEAFDAAIKDYGERGEVALKSGKKAGRKPHITWDARALLLIAVESEKKDAGRSENRAQKIIAAGEEWDVLTRKWGGPGWQLANTVKAQLRITRHMCDEDPEFAAYVDRTRDIIDDGWEPTDEEIRMTDEAMGVCDAERGVSDKVFDVNLACAMAKLTDEELREIYEEMRIYEENRGFNG